MPESHFPIINKYMTSTLAKLEAAILLHDPSYFSSSNEQTLRAHLTHIIIRDYCPVKALSSIACKPQSAQRTLSAQLKLIKPSAPTGQSTQVGPSPASIRNPATAAAVEARAIRSNSVHATLLWLQHIILVLDPDKDPGPSTFPSRLAIIADLIFFNASSPYNPLRITQTVP